MVWRLPARSIRKVDLIDISGATNIANKATGMDYDNPDPVTIPTTISWSWPDNDFITQDGHMQGNPYVDASGINNDTLLLVYRVTLPSYQAPAKK